MAMRRAYLDGGGWRAASLVDQGLLKLFVDLPGGTVNGSQPVNAGDMGLIPGLGRFHMPWSN